MAPLKCGAQTILRSMPGSAERGIVSWTILGKAGIRRAGMRLDLARRAGMVGMSHQFIFHSPDGPP